MLENYQFWDEIKFQGCHYKASRIAGLSGFGLLLGLGSMATAFGNIAKISRHTEENYKGMMKFFII